LDKNKITILKEAFDIDLSEEKIELFIKYEKTFLEKNSKVNLISKNDEKFLFEKHVFDSLAIHKFLGKWMRTQENAESLNPLTLALSHGGRGERSENSSTVQPFNSSPVRLLDIGTGGGFPSVPIAIFYDNINVFAIDSIRKKISVIEEMKADLELKNLFPVCGRVENLQFGNNPKAYDYITTRAVAPMDKILKYAMPNLKRGGYFIAYKSKKALEELKEAEKTLKLLGAKIEDIIEYTLPMEEVFERNLVIVKKR